MKTTLQISIIFILIKFLVACAPKSDSKSSPAGMNSRPAPSDQVQGKFEAQAEIKSSEMTDLLKCSESSSKSPKFNEKTRVGQTFELEDVDMSEAGFYMGGMERLKILSISSDRKEKTEERTLKNDNREFVFEQGCVLKEDSYSCEAKISKGGFGKEGNEVIRMSYCYTNYNSSSKTEKKFEVGTYTFKSGKIVKAYRVQESFTGDLQCSNQGKDYKNVGAGRTSRTLIYSAELPNITYPFCSELATISEVSKAQLDAGTVKAHKKFEIIDFKN